MKNIDETRNYLIEEINQDKWMSKKYKAFNSVLKYIGYLLMLISMVTGSVSTSAFASLVGIPIITAGTKKWGSIIKKKKKKHDQILSLAKSKLNSVEVFISKALIDSNISYDEFFLTNDVPKNLLIWK